jgi:hypothetical protein
MRRYGMSVKFTGTTYVEVDVPNGEDPEIYAMDIANPKDVDNWEIIEVYGLDEVDPNEP